MASNFRSGRGRYSGAANFGNVVSDQHAFTGSLTVTSNFTASADLLVEGDLNVKGAVNTVTHHETELHIADKVVLVASGSANAAAADGAGLQIAGASANLLYDAGTTQMHLNKDLNVTGALTASSGIKVTDISLFSADVTVTGAINATSFTGDGTGITGITATASPAGSDGQLQYNNGGSTGGASVLSFDDTANALAISGRLTASNAMEITGGVKVKASSYINWGTDDESTGYGIRDNGGTIQWKNSGGSWANVGSGTGGGSGDVSATSSLGDNRLIRGDADDEGIQQSGITVDDNNNISGVSNLSASSGLLVTSHITAGDGITTVSSKFSASNGLAVTGAIEARGGIIARRYSTSASYTIKEQDYIIAVDTAGASGNVTLTLPSCTIFPSGKLYIVKDEGGAAATNSIIISRAGSDTIDGETSVTLDSNYAAVSLYGDGTTSWYIY